MLEVSGTVSEVILTPHASFGHRNMSYIRRDEGHIFLDAV